MPFDLGVEVVDEIVEKRLQKPGCRDDPLGVKVRSSPRTTEARDNGQTIDLNP